MKKVYLLTILLISGLIVSAQSYKKLSGDFMNYSKTATKAVKEGNIFPLNQTPNMYVHTGKAVSEIEIGNTFYDLQSNTSPSNRFYMYEDGTMAAVWTMGMNTNGYTDRGTGYNYFNGADWQPKPSARIEGTQRTGWPTYAPQGNGEIVAAHHNTAGFVISRRDQKGTGEWSQDILAGPTGATDISWPNICSSGPDRMNVHLLGMTFAEYEGLDLALLYYRSIDGGASWNIQHSILPGMGDDEYVGFSADTYTWAEPKGDTIAFVVGGSWTDLFIMKSNDGGDSWEKIMVWEHPYPMFDGEPMDTTYVPDGTSHIAFDNSGKLHVAFGTTRVRVEAWPEYNYWPYAGGIAYWNEDMPAWTNTDINTLSPESLDETGNLIAWNLDLNENGELDVVDDYGNYGLGSVSMPQITIDENGFVYLVYSAITEGYDNTIQQYRHIWARGSNDGGITWGDFFDVTGDILHLSDECVFPTIANRTSPDRVHIIYQVDNEPGLALGDDADDPSQNVIYYTEFDKSDVVNIGIKDIDVSEASVSQNYPNPFSGSTEIGISLKKAANVSLVVNDLTGREVINIPAKQLTAGNHLIPVNASSLSKGVYTYSVVINDRMITNKMIVK